MAIMDELREKLNYLSVCTQPVLAALQQEENQALADTLGPEVMKLLTEQVRLEETNILANAGEGGFNLGEDNEEVREEMKQLQKNTLELCRKMKVVAAGQAARGAGNIVADLRTLQERPYPFHPLLKTLGEMQELTVKRLTTTVEEEKSRQELLEHYKSREAEASRRRKQLQADLDHISQEWDRDKTQWEEILMKLQADLGDVKDNKVERMTNLRNHYETRMREHQESFEAKRDEMQKKINALREQNAKARNASLEEEAAKKKAAKRYETDVESLIKQYDEKVRELASELSDLNEGLRKDTRVYNELKEHFEKVDEEKECIRAEEALTEARATKFAAERDRQNAASALVQAFWRGIKQRQDSQDLKKKMKKKPAGKGKAKK